MDIQIRCCVCDTDKGIEIHDAQPWCKSCWETEEQAQKDIQDTADERVAKVNARAKEINDLHTLEKQLAVDTTIKVTSDVFNAKTVAIVELKNAIDADDSIENKQFELAKRLKTRFEILTTAIFERNKQNLEDSSEQRSIQSYLNNLSNQLREKEREELKLKDLTYQPAKPSKPSKPKKKAGPKFNKAEIREHAAKIGVDEYTLQMICVSKNMQPAEAAEELQKMVQSSKSN